MSSALKIPPVGRNDTDYEVNLQTSKSRITSDRLIVIILNWGMREIKKPALLRLKLAGERTWKQWSDLDFS